MPLYALYKIKHLWPIDPYEKRLEVFEFVGNKYRLKGVYGQHQSFRSPLSGLILRCKDIF
jgi:hypothetical protein